MSTAAVSRGAQCGERCGDGGAGERGKIFMKGRVGVEVFRPGQPREDFRRMRAEDDFIRYAFAGRGPDDRQFRLGFQKCGRGRDAAGMLRMTGAQVAGAAFVGDDFHSGIKPRMDTDARGFYAVQKQF